MCDPLRGWATMRFFWNFILWVLPELIFAAKPTWKQRSLRIRKYRCVFCRAVFNYKGESGLTRPSGTYFKTPSCGKAVWWAQDARLFRTIVSSMSCQKSLHKYFGLPNIEFFWHWIYYYCSHLVAINISNSNFLIQGIFFKLSVTLSIFYANEKNKLGPRIQIW